MSHFRYHILPAILLSYLLVECSVLQIASEYIHKKEFSSSTENISISLHRIDDAITYEFYFLLQENEEKIKIEAIGMHELEEADKHKNEIPIFYVLEKHYFKEMPDNQIREFYITIGKNHSNSWQISDNASFISNSNDPLKKLDQGIYRIRFTAFSKAHFNFRFYFFSQKKPVIISPEMGELLQIKKGEKVEPDTKK